MVEQILSQPWFLLSSSSFLAQPPAPHCSPAPRKTKQNKTPKVTSYEEQSKLLLAVQSYSPPPAMCVGSLNGCYHADKQQPTMP